MWRYSSPTTTAPSPSACLSLSFHSAFSTSPCHPRCLSHHVSFLSPVAVPFQSWASNVAELKRLAIAAAKIIIRWQTMALSRPWLAWVDRVGEKQRLQRAATRVLRRWNACYVAPAFQTWVEVHSKTNAMALAGAKVILRWRNLQLTQSLSSWLEAVRTTRLTARVLTRWSCKTMLGAFCLWSDHAQAQTQARGNAFAAVKKMLNGCLAMAFAAWAAEHAECKRLQAAAVRVVYRWQQMSMALPFTTWHDHVAEAKQLKRAAEKVVNRWSCMSMAAPFYTWQNNVSEKLRLQLAASKVVVRWRLMALGRPWLAWCDRTENKNRLKRISEKILRRWSKSDHAPAFNAWKQMYLSSKHNKLSSSKIIRRWKSGTLVAAFDRWCEQVSRQRRLVSAAHTVMARWMNVGLVQHFEQWLFLVEDRKWADQVQHDRSKQEACSTKLAELSADCERFASESLQKGETIECLRQTNQVLQDQVSDLEEQNLLNWTRWTETRRTAEQEANDLIAERNAESEKLADLQSKYELLQSDVTYLQTRLDAKRVMVNLLRGNLQDAERLARGVQAGLALAFEESVSMSIENSRINGIKAAVLGTNSGHAFNGHTATHLRQ